MSQSFMDEFTSDLDRMMDESESVKNVIKLLFSSLTVVFQETTELSSSSSQPPYFKYNRISSIPYKAARMLWSEILGDVSFDGELFRVSNPDDVDKAISRSCLEEFIKVMNDPTELTIIKKVDSNSNKGIFSRLFGSKKKDENIVKIPKRRISRDLFMAFIRDILVTTELLEINELKTECNENNIEMNDESEEVFAPKYFKGSFTGWERGKKVSTSRYFQIFQDKYFQYGIYLSGIMNNSSALPSTLAAPATASIEHRKMDTMKRWNNAMSNACRKQLEKRDILDTDENEGTNDDYSKLKDMNLGDEDDDATNYAAKMYPSHLMRAGRAPEVSPLLINPKFLLARLSVLGPIETVSRLKSDLDEMIFRFKLASERKLSMDTTKAAERKLSMDSKAEVLSHDSFQQDSAFVSSDDVFLNSFLLLVKCIEEHYPIINCRRVAFIRGENNIGEIGRVLHLIAAYINEAGETEKKNQSDYSSHVVKIYKLSLGYKIAALGNDHISVGRTYRYLGHKFSDLRKYQKAIDAYAESIRISWAQSKIDYKQLVATLNSLGMIYSMAGLLEEVRRKD